MPQYLALSLTTTIDRELPHLRSLPDDRSSIPRAPGKWSPREELGHLIDSATNNHVRFVRVAIGPEFRGPGYAQDDWVRLHNYRNMPWETITTFWFQYNTFLAALIAQIPEERMESPCYI